MFVIEFVNTKLMAKILTLGYYKLIQQFRQIFRALLKQYKRTTQMVSTFIGLFLIFISLCQNGFIHRYMNANK